MRAVLCAQCSHLIVCVERVLKQAVGDLWMPSLYFLSTKPVIAPVPVENDSVSLEFFLALS